jgi:predicted nuclease of predicted toxin-antitoxin system
LKVLFDENVPHKLRRNLVKHSVRTVVEMGWVGMRNGELLNRAEAEGFDVLVTGDQNLTFQQNLIARRIAIVVLDTNNWKILRLRPELVVRAVEAATRGSVRTVECVRS